MGVFAKQSRLPRLAQEKAILMVSRSRCHQLARLVPGSIGTGSVWSTLDEGHKKSKGYRRTAWSSRFINPRGLGCACVCCDREPSLITRLDLARDHVRNDGGREQHAKSARRVPALDLGQARTTLERGAERRGAELSRNSARRSMSQEVGTSETRRICGSKCYSIACKIRCTRKALINAISGAQCACIDECRSEPGQLRGCGKSETLYMF